MNWGMLLLVSVAPQYQLPHLTRLCAFMETEIAIAQFGKFSIPPLRHRTQRNKTTEMGK
jgi:hypothetical protein